MPAAEVLKHQEGGGACGIYSFPGSPDSVLDEGGKDEEERNRNANDTQEQSNNALLKAPFADPDISR